MAPALQDGGSQIPGMEPLPLWLHSHALGSSPAQEIVMEQRHNRDIARRAVYIPVRKSCRATDWVRSHKAEIPEHSRSPGMLLCSLGALSTNTPFHWQSLDSFPTSGVLWGSRQTVQFRLVLSGSEAIQARKKIPVTKANGGRVCLPWGDFTGCPVYTEERGSMSSAGCIQKVWWGWVWGKSVGFMFAISCERCYFRWEECTLQRIGRYLPFVPNITQCSVSGPRNASE